MAAVTSDMLPLKAAADGGSVADIMPVALREVSTIMTSLQEGLQRFAEVDNSVTDPELLGELAKLVQDLDANTTETLNWTTAFQNGGLQSLSRTCTAMSSALQKTHDLRAASPADADIKEQLKNRIMADVHCFGTQLKAIPSDLFTTAIQQLEILETRWSKLGKDVQELIGKLETFKGNMVKEAIRMKKLSFWCKVGAGAVVLLGIGATVGLAVTTGGIAVVPEILGGCSILMSAGAGSAALMAKSRHYSAEADKCAKAAAAAGATTSILGAAFAAAKTLAGMGDDSRKMDEAVTLTEAILVTLKHVHSQCEDLARGCKETNTKVHFCKTDWDKLMDKYVPAELPCFAEIVVADLLSKSSAELQTVMDAQHKATHSVEELDKQVRELAEKCDNMYKAYSRTEGGKPSLKEVVNNLLTKQAQLLAKKGKGKPM